MGSEVLVPLSVIAVLGSMLLPMPPALLDVLLVANLTAALVLLISALYVRNPLRMSSLPTMLLLATLYRLGLNVSTTRLILGRAQAGRVVEAFGNVVAGGNVLVGAAVFLVITLIQFIVIAKGAERVAEVSARFTLDALPGKQMSIDADVRAGLIDFDGARRKREELQVESRFYGALDGAMKFIKGDAVAGMIIIVVNIAGGFAAGLLLSGMGLAETLRHFTLLTIGDGLVSQIPALLNALSAGVIVTRVVRSEEASLSADLLAQLGQERSAQTLIGGLSLLLAMLPGMPALPFVGAGAVLLLVAATRAKPVPAALPVRTAFRPAVPAPVRIVLPDDIAAQVDPPRFAERLRNHLFESRGVLIAVPEVIAGSGDELCVELRGNSVLRQTPHGATPADRAADAAAIAQAALQRFAHELVDDIVTRRTLDAFDKDFPELVAAVVPPVVSVTQLTEVLRALVAEHVPVRNFDVVLQAVSEHGPKAGSERALLESVRIALRRTICAGAAGSGVLTAVVLDPAADAVFACAEREHKLVDPGAVSALAEGVRESAQTGTVLLASRPARRLVRELLALQGVEITVLAHEELAEDVRVAMKGRIALSPGVLGTFEEALAA